MSESASFAPFFARLTASARPMPDPAPVMTATLPSNGFIWLLPLHRWCGSRKISAGGRAYSGRCGVDRCLVELQQGVLDGVVEQHLGVLLVVHEYLPRVPGTLARQSALGALHVARLQLVEHADIHRGVLEITWRCHRVAVVVHMLEQR